MNKLHQIDACKWKIKTMSDFLNTLNVDVFSEINLNEILGNYDYCSFVESQNIPDFMHIFYY